ncbi:MAG: cytidylate kinase-like family protein [Oscillospiraceae bacterium]|nr:cytidylate kinase-like family protein [Oscillospiraceae bacterium]MDY2847534.1 cytidylate kinase-like family protein [Oscillospiraceae bacterium]
MENYVITISRAFGSGGRTIGKMLSERLGIPYYDKDLIKLASEHSGINESLFGLADERISGGIFKKGKVYDGEIKSPSGADFTSEDNLFSFQAKVIKELAEKKSPCIIIGRCADFVLADRENTLRIFIWADKETCVKNTMDVCGWDRKESEKQVDKINRERSAYYKSHTGHDWADVRNYDLCLDTNKLGFEKCTKIIEDYINILYK